MQTEPSSAAASPTEQAITASKYKVRQLRVLEVGALVITLSAIAILFVTRGLGMVHVSQMQAVVVAAIASIGVSAAVVASVLSYKYVLALQVIEFRITTTASRAEYPTVTISTPDVMVRRSESRSTD